MTTLKPYQPNLKKIIAHTKNLEPLTLTPEEYDQILKEYGFVRGARLSDVGILKAMEAGLIKIADKDGRFDLLKQIQSAGIDLRLGHEFWHYSQHKISRLTMGKHIDVLKDLHILEYNYKVAEDVFVFHPHSLVLAMIQEFVSLSNVVVGNFDGKSSAGRLGLSNHQTAGQIEPGFAGQIMMEISNTNQVDVAVAILERIGSLSFTLLDQPSSRPRNLKTDSQSWAYKQISPFGFRDSRWEIERKKAIADGKKIKSNFQITGDYEKLKGKG